MKNKIFSIVLLICLVLPLALAFSGCGMGIKINVRYQISHVEIVWGSESEKNEILESEGITEDQLKDIYKGGNLLFENNYVVSIDSDNGNSRDYYYIEENNFINIYHDSKMTKFYFELEIVENSLIRIISDENHQTYIILTYQAQ